jgi:2-polyprenyl-3-methyl-5-hydroxy-6-metoxy-1,4-benzoquinol methylase
VAVAQRRASHPYDELERVRKSNPHPLQPPQRSLRIDALMWFASRAGRRLPWPAYHSHSKELVRHEYEDFGANANFWDAFAGRLKPADLAGKDVLDVGCGWGGKSIALAERVGIRYLAGFDLPSVFEPEVTQQFADSRHLYSAWKTGYGEAIPFPDQRFDVALLDDVLEHVNDPPSVLNECSRVLRPGGLIIAKFPSIRMIKAHHLDRAINLPGIHYLASWETWTAGLNDYLLRHRDTVNYVPFSEVVTNSAGRRVPRGMSGLDWQDAQTIIARSPFRVRHLRLVGAPLTVRERVNPLIVSAYELIRAIPPLREFLSTAIAFVGERRGT